MVRALTGRPIGVRASTTGYTRYHRLHDEPHGTQAPREPKVKVSYSKQVEVAVGHE